MYLMFPIKCVCPLVCEAELCLFGVFEGFFAIGAAVFGGTDAVSQTWETPGVNYELSSLSEKCCAAELSCCYEPRRHQLSLGLNSPSDQPDFIARC